MPEKFDFSKIEDQKKTKERESEIETVEEELSPEAVERIMEKVQDINRKGTAYHFLKCEGFQNPMNDLKNVLREGLLGSSSWLDDYDRYYDSKEPKMPSRKVRWAQDFKKYRESLIFFNIVQNIEGQKFTRIENSYYAGGRKKAIILLFNLKLNEDEKRKINERRGIYDTEFGFTLSPRIAPRLFKGIIVKGQFFPNPDELKKEKENLFSQVIEEMLAVNKENPSLLLPVYDINGYLVWPKKMSYGQVKKFVAERDKNKQEIEEKAE